MELEAIRAETQRALEEAGGQDEDLSYLTQEHVDTGQRDARDVSELSQEQRAEFEAEGEAAAYNYLHSCWFTGGPGSKVYGYLASTTGTCNRNWYMVMTWRTRSILRRCGTSGPYIWKIG